MGRFLRWLRADEGQVGSAGVAAAAIPTAVLGLQVAQPDVLPATGVALGMYVLIALICITAGFVMRQAARRMDRGR